MVIANRFVTAITIIASGNIIAAFTTPWHAAHRNSWPISKCEAVTTILQSKFDDLDDVFLLSIDGTLATTSRSRSLMAIGVALKVWPTLKSNMEALGMSHEAFCVASKEGFRYKCDNHKQHEWLLQKLSALSSITQQGNDPDAMLGCDEVLMVRLLLEEQRLDGGRSNGRGGKYGGKFHPSTTSPSSSSADGQGKSIVGSRPLTVGELYANWSELRDVTRMKYPVINEDSNGKAKHLDPMPYIRQYLRELVSTPYDGERHTWQPLVWDILFGCQSDFNNGNGGIVELRQNTILLLGHDAQICLTLNSLSLLGYEFDIETDLINRDEGGESMLERLSTSNRNNSKDHNMMKVVVTTSSKVQERLGQGLLLVAPDAQTGETHSKMIERIVLDLNERPQNMENIYLIHSSLEVLKQCKAFLGEDAYVY